MDSVLIAQPEGDSLGMGIWLVLPLLTAFIIIFFSKVSRNNIYILDGNVHRAF